MGPGVDTHFEAQVAPCPAGLAERRRDGSSASVREDGVPPVFGAPCFHASIVPPCGGLLERLQHCRGASAPQRV
eukprot:9021253-Lingulodinium_polyedra.AAC.1